MKLDRSFYTREDTAQVARDLLGKLLVVPTEDGIRVSGVIVETEAYLGTIDRAAHSYGGRRTVRTEATYLLGGHAYVFFVYGMYYQLNVVTGPAEHNHVVLLRGVRPLEGIEAMRARRGIMKDQNLTSGPGKLCIAFGIDKTYNKEDLLGSRIWLEDHIQVNDIDVKVGKRIGIDYAGEDVHLPLRFWLRGDPYVSRPRS